MNRPVREFTFTANSRKTRGQGGADELKIDTGRSNVILFKCAKCRIQLRRQIRELVARELSL